MSARSEPSEPIEETVEPLNENFFLSNFYLLSTNDCDLCTTASDVYFFIKFDKKYTNVKVKITSRYKTFCTLFIDHLKSTGKMNSEINVVDSKNCISLWRQNRTVNCTFVYDQNLGDITGRITKLKKERLMDIAVPVIGGVVTGSVLALGRYLNKQKQEPKPKRRFIT